MIGRGMKRLLAVLALICIFAINGPAVYAQNEEDTPSGEAKELTSWRLVTQSRGLGKTANLFDGSVYKSQKAEAGAWLTLESGEGIGSLYISYGLQSGDRYTVTDNATGVSVQSERAPFVHEFVDLTELFGYAPVSVTVNFGDEPCQISEIQAFSAGQVPDSIQKWNPPAEGETDLLLFSAHGDDDQLFFAGILPYYAGELGYRVQVVYMTDHHNNQPFRIHEMLNGLWAVGVDVYPVLASFNDFYVDEGNMELAYRTYKALGCERDTLMDFVVTQLRRFRPQVVVTHDFQGEYGHAQHLVCADLVAEAVTISADGTQFPASAEKYGTWDPPKAYFHLYEENPIVLDLDKPLERFGGMTAYEVTRDLGYACHESQYKDFEWYYRGFDTAAEVEKYNPCNYGLYRSTVGEDRNKNDFFENVLTYAQQEQKAEEERLAEEKRLEEERLAEEARREEEERQAEEESRRETELLNRPQTTPGTSEIPENPQLQKVRVAAIVACLALPVLVFMLVWELRKK